MTVLFVPAMVSKWWTPGSQKGTQTSTGWERTLATLFQLRDPGCSCHHGPVERHYGAIETGVFRNTGNEVESHLYHVFNVWSQVRHLPHVASLTLSIR